MIGFDRRFAAHLAHRHLRVLGQQLGHHALPVRRQMSNCNEANTALLRHPCKKFFESLKAAGRRSHTDQEGWRGWFPTGRFLRRFRM